MKANEQKSGQVRCQRCLKYGHYTYECSNEVAYRYRPSRTVMFKEQIKTALNRDRGPETRIKNPDFKRRVPEDRPSSEDEAQQDNPNQQHRSEAQNSKPKLQDQSASSEEQAEQQESSSESSSDSSSSSSDSSSDSSSSDSDAEEKIAKKVKL